MSQAADIQSHWYTLEDLLNGIEIKADKAKYINGDLLEMEEDSKEDYIKLYNWSNVQMLSNILFDYVLMLAKDIQSILEEYRILYNQNRGENGENSN